MFQPAVFCEAREDVLHGAIRAHPLATLITHEGGRIEADHVPMVLHAAGDAIVLRSHLNAANPLPRSGAEVVDALAVFQGPQAYVSPGWYASKREHGKAVPTWNYVSVHARGALSIIRGDAAWLTDHLTALSAQQESHRDEPWALSDAPADYIARLLRRIVGLELRVSELTGVWKMSQNKSETDRSGVVEGLRLDAKPDVSDLVAQLTTS